ncbi:MAG: hypothetical protein LBL69_00050 [Zoogloeaceae bacterium]|nr:hypothetical protein [Zoogloeaceae bacterium]
MRGSSRLEHLVFLSIFLLAAGLFVWIVRDYQAEAEKLSVELTISSIRTGLTIRIGDAMFHPEKGIDGRALIGSNPVELLSAPPAGYLGAFRGLQAELLPTGSWFFDSGTGELVYRLMHDSGFEATAPALAVGKSEIRWMLMARGGVPESTTKVVENAYVPLENIVLTPTVKYTWH